MADTWTEYFYDPLGQPRTFRGLTDDAAIALSVQLQQQGWQVVQRVMEQPGDREALASTPAAAEYAPSTADLVERARTAIPGSLQSTTAQAIDQRNPTVGGAGQSATGVVVGPVVGPGILAPIGGTTPEVNINTPAGQSNLVFLGALAIALFIVFGD